MGPIFIRDEGGFEVIMRALNHYNKRLNHIADTPELAQAGAVFGTILQSESAKASSKLKPLANKLRAGLTDPDILATLHDDIEIMEKAMRCYKADCQKATQDIPYYTEMLGKNMHVQDDVQMLDKYINRLKQYSE